MVLCTLEFGSCSEVQYVDFLVFVPLEVRMAWTEIVTCFDVLCESLRGVTAGSWYEIVKMQTWAENQPTKCGGLRITDVILVCDGYPTAAGPADTTTGRVHRR